MTERAPVTYRDAGVDIDAADELVERIKPRVRRSMRPEVLGGIGGFGALVEVPLDRYRRPVLVSGTDGGGTKLRLAIDTRRHDTVGIDLVAMCVNDVVVQGAEPLFFLDYFATGKLDVGVGERLIAGIVEGCVQAGCALVGGETAEMPGSYHGEDYDLAGFCVGVVEKDAIIDGGRTRAGDAIIGLASSGPHSNGYSLIRKLLAGARATAHADPYLREAAAGAAAGDARARPGAHHRRRFERQSAAGTAPGARSGAGAPQLAPRSGVRLAAACRAHRACGDVPHFQLWRRHGRDRAARARPGRGGTPRGTWGNGPGHRRSPR